MNKRLLEVLRFTVSNREELGSVVSRIRENSALRSGEQVTEIVSTILSEVKTRGNQALIKYGRRFDSPSIVKPQDLLVKRTEIEEAYSKIRPEQLSAIKNAYKQIQWLANEQVKRFEAKKLRSPLGFEIRERYEPLKRIGGYVPGGLASYPSTVLMICGPARAAGVKDIVLCTPPGKDGRISEAVLVAADVCGVTEIVKSGGAQAIGALAYGTATVKKVDLIAGPGNAYVTEAKRQVSSSGEVLIDSLAGPTELLILADKNANAGYIFEDLISQAEHGNRTLCGVVSESSDLLESVVNRISSTAFRNRMEYIKSSFLFAVKVKSKKMIVEFAQEFAPEHLEVMLGKGDDSKFTNSGMVLVGDYTPCSSTDYIVGTNHILPTGGSARLSSGLAVENFLKRVTIVKGSKGSLRESSRYITSLSTIEGLPNHAGAALSRFGEGS
ncbi:MAG: histidinol dehydrogenase [Thaumarchaeota archaeon]|nr:histidinol dehydrogenase [Nitrososphaerota archaeon]